MKDWRSLPPKDRLLLLSRPVGLKAALDRYWCTECATQNRIGGNGTELVTFHPDLMESREEVCVMCHKNLHKKFLDSKLN